MYLVQLTFIFSNFFQGQERFRALSQAYYKNTQGIILVYDISEPSSFKNLQQWMEEIKKHGTQKYFADYSS